MFTNDWPTTEDMVFGNGRDLSGWILDFPLLDPNGIDVVDDKNQAYYSSVFSSVALKASKFL